MFATYAPGFRRLALLGVLIISLPTIATAQFEFPDFGGPGGGGFGSKREAEVTISAEFTPAEGSKPALVFVTAKIAPGYHVYAVDQGSLPDGGGGPLPTTIALENGSSVKLTGIWQATTQPVTHVDQEIWTGLELREHEGMVTWFAPVHLPAGSDPAALVIKGIVEGQACNPQTCVPFGQSFEAHQGIGVPLPANTTFTALAPQAATSELVASETTSEIQSPAVSLAVPTSAAAYDLSRLNVETEQGGSLSYYLLLAFVGGLILNIMPCVLPVIGLKVMSFVQQAGQSRAQALALNCWYAAGIIVVFLILASLAVTLQIGWGGQFGSAGFNITLIAIVFAMALSLLGLWEIPIPGFVGSGAAINFAEREGPTAAFLKGVLTTILATPCTGPFMASALAWAVRQPMYVTFSVFGVLGLGMASPYLVIGAFPGLVKFLPKPGMWMETFKKVMGLVLLGTVVWLLTFIEPPLVVPTIALMVGIAAGCWWISQADITAPFEEKAKVWGTACLLIALSAYGSFGWLYRDVMLPRFERAIATYAQDAISKERLEIAGDLNKITTLAEKDGYVANLIADAADEGDQPWQPFSLAKLQRKVVEEGRTVLVDFTADWCLTCKTYEKLALKTEDVAKALNAGDVVTMVADYTRRPPMIEKTLRALKANGVPVIAIFPASDPYNPIIFRDGYTEQAILDALTEAAGGPGARAAGGNTALSQAPNAEPRM
jgi:thiol:disulfide interchange protein DsbD